MIEGTEEDRCQIAHLLIEHRADVFLNIFSDKHIHDRVITIPDIRSEVGTVSLALPQDKLGSLLREVRQIKIELNGAIMLLIKGQRDSKSFLSLLPLETIRKINDAARFTLVVSWAEERMANKARE
jgi:hypothetical protein